MRFLAPAMLDYVFGSLDEATAASDVIVRGAISEVYVGEEWKFNEVEPAVPLVYARVVVTEVLKGDPVARLPGTIEVLLGPLGDEAVAKKSPFPPEEAIWFLMSRAAERERLDRPPVDSEIAPYAYFRPNTFQAVIRDIDGHARPMFADQIRAAYGKHTWPAPLEGSSYPTLVGDVRSAVAAGSQEGGS